MKNRILDSLEKAEQAINTAIDQANDEAEVLASGLTDQMSFSFLHQALDMALRDIQQAKALKQES